MIKCVSTNSLWPYMMIMSLFVVSCFTKYLLHLQTQHSMNLFVRRLVYRPYKLKKNLMSWLLHPLLHPFSSLNLISLVPILVVQIGNPTNFVNIARNMATLLRLIIAVIETLLLLLILIQIKHSFLLLLSTLDPPSHSPQINWRTSLLRLSSGLVIHSLPLLFLSCLVSYLHGFLTLSVAIT